MSTADLPSLSASPREGRDTQAQVRADDALLDALGGRLTGPVVALADELSDLLLRWRVDVDDNPVPIREVAW